MTEEADRSRLIDTSARFARHRVHSHIEKSAEE